MTEITTSEGKIYLATVIDLHSRRLLGYAMDAHHDAELIVAALNMAAATRGGNVTDVVFTPAGAASTPRSSSAMPATAWVWCSPWGASGRRSTTRSPRRPTRRSRWNTSTGQQFRPQSEARIKIATWITDWYNPHRRHSACD